MSAKLSSPDRRQVLAASATVAASSLIPRQTRAVTTSDAIRPFRVDVPDELLVDLRRRLAATRWPDRETARMNRKVRSSRRCKNSRAIGGQVTTGANARPN